MYVWMLLVVNVNIKSVVGICRKIYRTCSIQILLHFLKAVFRFKELYYGYYYTLNIILHLFITNKVPLGVCVPLFEKHGSRVYTL